jgi:hypothetical protein
MAIEIPGFLWSLPAASDLSALQFRALIADGSGEAEQNTSAGGDIIGVLQDDPVAGQPAAIMSTGVTKMEAGAAVTQGGVVMSDNVGRAVDATATNKGIGIALDAAAGAGEIISVLLKDLGTQ